MVWKKLSIIQGFHLGIFDFLRKKPLHSSEPSAVYKKLVDAVHHLQSDFINGDYRHPHQDFSKFANAFSSLSKVYLANQFLFSVEENAVFDQFFEVFGGMTSGNAFQFTQAQMYYSKCTYPDFNQTIDHLFERVFYLLDKHDKS